ncbi:MAG: DUF2961 domain-containing protein [Candidatus Hydrogenedentes bacterium]|nr:DUF2961 domain-containing protein [Candidatus Hydrogenedentota bacterium]
MRKGKHVLMAVAAAAVVWCGVPAHGADVTFESLVRQMTDLSELASFPKPAFTCKQFSSYDRRSTDPAVLTDENWFANGDRGQHLRTEERNGETEWVLMDAEGPGAIVRVWSANPNDAGTVRFYLDGAPHPVIEMPLTALLGGGDVAPLVPPISGERSRGWNCHLPIPYARHCKVTASKPDFYYQINYRTYKPGTDVETYTPELVAQQAALIQDTAARLSNPSAFEPPAGAERRPVQMDLAAGAVWTCAFQGPAAICRIALHPEAADLEAALRGCVLEIAFDGEDAPSVEVPLGDFFGMAPGLVPYGGLPSGVTADGVMYSHWVMPFRKTAALKLWNRGDKALSIRGAVIAAPHRWTRRSLRFHATWRGEYPIPTQPRQDWTYLDVVGRGRFVGDMLHVTNPVKDWWGEGDEKIYVDGEAFPSHFGTGSEDYYGYAWCCPDLFTHAYHNQPRCDGPGNYGQTCVNRFHIIDTIPFTKSFRFDIEVWHWAECRIAMAATSYWYARPGASDAFKPIEPDALCVVPPEPLPAPKRVEGAIEGESMTIVSKDGGDATAQETGAFGWSNAAQLWWIDAAPGNTLVFTFPCEKAGRYEVRAVFTKAADYGIARVSINGTQAGDAMDFYNDGVVLTPEESLGTFDLKEGANEMKVEITGANEKAIPRHMFGLDYLLLKPAS